ncbi:MAG: fibrobacter succinogenes major paralogous domain-containing protein [Bacteroidales bacterium]|nr:fibrobacter succinogenes major paralogous domain-containing protein [Bacteroidales bacterium]
MKKSLIILSLLALIVSSCKTLKNSAIHEKSIVINGVKWATCNVAAPGTFATAPEELGMLYQWNSKIGWSIDTLTFSENWTVYGSCQYNSTTWKRANDPCPQGWRIPTRPEFINLVNASVGNKEWITINGQGGYKLGVGENTIFLPAAGSGVRHNATMRFKGAGSLGFYWTTTFNTTKHTPLPYQFNPTNEYFSSGGGCYAGFSVRCVAK